MKPIQRILVPTDFSAHSTEALRFAADLARRYEASLDLLHVFQTTTHALPEGYVLPSAEELERIVQAFQQSLDAAKRTAIECGASNVETVLLQGWISEEIPRFAKERGCDLIVMGTHGRTGVKHLLIGSIAEHVVRSAPCPVLTVRAPG
ncbi:MAG TPA: universal stress protein [Polyangiales bacterium]|nr:universal stress protein [Polyangiales bacterium]